MSLQIIRVPGPSCQHPCDPDCEVGPLHCEFRHLPNHTQGWHDPQDCDRNVLFAIFSDGTTRWTATRPLTEQEVVDFFRAMAARNSEIHSRSVLADVRAGRPERAYAQFTMSFTEANQQSVAAGGVDLIDYKAKAMRGDDE